MRYSILILVAALSACLKTPLTPAQEEALTSPANTNPLVIVTNTGYEIDLSDFRYQREYADCGYLVKQQAESTEVYRVEFTHENGGNYTYEYRLSDGSIVGSGRGTFHFKN